jgi:uncharacterized membrane protein (DUF485 family)
LKTFSHKRGLIIPTDYKFSIIHKKGDEIVSKSSKNKPENAELDYEKIINTPEFKELVKRKGKFSTPYMIFFFVALFTLPILTGYTTILENRAIGSMTWTWVYSFGMFVMVWLFTSIYMNKAKSFDVDVEEILKKHVVK